MTESQPSRTLLLTRSKEENERIAPLFEAAGFQTIGLPGIEIAEPDDWTGVDEVIATLEHFDGVLFTSKNAVRGFLGRLSAVRGDGRSILARLTIAAVGETTEECLEAEGLPPSITPEVGSAEGLLESLGELELKGKRFLFPKSSIARDIIPAALREAGAEVEDVVVYRTIPPEQRALDSIREGLLDGTIGGVIFFSPSAVRNIVQMLGLRCLESACLCVIGPTTAAAVMASGLHPSVQSATTTTEGMIASLTHYFDTERA